MSIWGKKIDAWVNGLGRATGEIPDRRRRRVKPSDYIGWGVLVWAVGGGLYLSGGDTRPLGVLVALVGIGMVLVGIIGAGVSAGQRDD